MIVRLPLWSSFVFGFDGVYQRGCGVSLRVLSARVQTVWTVRAFGVAGSPYELQGWDSLIDIWKSRERKMWFGLIPVGDRIEVVRAVVCVAVFHARTHGFGEGNG